ncbi:MAG: hypothetical protein KAI79_03215 [Bacteroidales bacterium]|nr:hypothetical protein [Bacteroidales bacterium]
MFRFIISFSFLFAIVHESPDFETHFGDDYSDALDFVKINSELIIETTSNYQVESDVLLSVLFPERIRYSIFRDYFETKALAMAYVDMGSDYVDFSIGDFQMKPSFIEAIDSCLMKDSILCEKYQSLAYSISDNDFIRRKRVERLQLIEYQLIYACAFYDISRKKHQIMEWAKLEELRFLASAYNHGFNRKTSEIKAYTTKAFFPYGETFPGEQFVYADIALDFYQNKYSKIIIY